MIAGLLGCLLFFVGIVYFAVWAAGQDFSINAPPPPLPPGAVYLPPPPPTSTMQANGEKHTPTDTSTDTWWTSFFLVVIFVVLLSTPACWYVPRYWNGSRAEGEGYSMVQRAPGSERVATAQQEAAVPSAPTAAPGQKDMRPLLAFRVEGDFGEHV